jgi:hypothetical protein
MAQAFPVIIGNITVRKFDNRVSRYVGNCSSGEKVTLSRYEFNKQSIDKCAQCRGMKLNLDDSFTERQGRTPSTPSKKEPVTLQPVKEQFKFEDTIVGRKYGQLLVTKIIPKSLKHFMRRIECRCLRCGNDVEIAVNSLVLKHKSKGEETDCGCSKVVPPTPKRVDNPIAAEALSIRIKPTEDLTGLRMGHLRILRQASVVQARRSKIKGRAWVVQCAACEFPTLYILSTGALSASIKKANHCPNCPQVRKGKKRIPAALVAPTKPKPVKVPSSARKAPSKQPLRSGVIS